MTAVSLVDGWLSLAVLLLGIAGFAFLLVRPFRWWWLRVVPAVLIVSALAGAAIGYFAGNKLFAEPLPLMVDVWIAISIAGVGLAIGYLFKARWWQRVLAVVAAILVVAAAGNQVNIWYHQYPELGDLLGVASEQEISGPPPIISGSGGQTTYAPLPAGPLTATWNPTGSKIPADGKGKMSTIDLPGTVSGFAARPGNVYYPPAYFADNPEPLPVLIMLPGQPGNTTDWFIGAKSQVIMDEFASTHNGIAPVVVIPDPLGSELANPMCADSSLGSVDTYLSKDVPDGIKKQLRVDPDTKHWVIGGFSYGGTCSLQMALNHPDIYPNFVDIAGETQQAIGSAEENLAVFGGDTAKLSTTQPLAQLTSGKRFPNTSGWFMWGSEDSGTKPGQQQLFAAAQAAGLTVQQWESVGTSHDWVTADLALRQALPWILEKTKLTA